jgi:ribosomal protein S18 acetylase RimI-like enzyme
MSFSFRAAAKSDAGAVSDLVNSVFRGESGARAWTGEAHLLEGQRTDAAAVADMINEKHARIILAYDQAGKLVGCVFIKADGSSCYLGMLTVDVTLQRSGLGSALMNEAERAALKDFSLREMKMTVISVRTELIDWYVRRGYRVTEEREPFPYGDERFGIPLRDDLEFVVLRKDLRT